MAKQHGRRLLALAAAYVVTQGLVLTLSPAVRERSWTASLRGSHWVGIILWLGIFVVLQRLLEIRFPAHDPYILAVCAILTGWGILTIWRLNPSYGFRQLIWLGASAAAVVALIGKWKDLGVLRRYKYVLLLSGLGLTALTIFMGTSPTGTGPRLWLGCCGVYLQPSEPLKLLLVVYLAAYLADHVHFGIRTFPMLWPTVFVAGLAIVLLLVQRDLGSASIIILLYTIMLYVATARKRVLVAGTVTLATSAFIGFFFLEIIHARLMSWMNPWLDPSGESFQIVQSLLSIANGGILGRGLGIGSPGLVPVSQSDFIFSAMAEEAGLAGSVGLLLAYGLLFTRGLVIALRSTDRFHQLLAAGVTAYLGIQCLLIIGGDLRILPLTGVTLPFVSYGGSSLITSSLAAAILMTISGIPASQHASGAARLPLAVLAAVLGLGIVAAILVQSWWTVIRGPDLLTRTDNARRSIADRYVVRGSLLDRNDTPINETLGESGALQRLYAYPELGPIVGYTHPTFGQAGLEASLDPYLRGTQGNPASRVMWDQLVYGTPPPGLDVRLTLDLPLQRRADQLLAERTGAIVLINARSGEILVMASHPTYDANALDSIGSTLLQEADRPLLNRATQGTYSIYNAALPLVAASAPGRTGTDVKRAYETLGFYSQPDIRMPTALAAGNVLPEYLHISPLQMAVAAAALSNGGVRPSPRIVLAVNTPRQGWIVLPALDESQRVFSPSAAGEAALRYSKAASGVWQWRTTTSAAGQTLTWYVAGTLPDWQGTPLTVVVLLENGESTAATRIGADILGAAAKP